MCLLSIKFDVLVMIVLVLVFVVMVWDGVFSCIEGSLFLFGVVVYIVLLVCLSWWEFLVFKWEFFEEYNVVVFGI